jgi:hypothetical protein
MSYGRYIRLLGLVAGAAMVVMAFVGAASAAAAPTKLCKKKEASCAAGNVYTAGTGIVAYTKEGSKPKLTASSGAWVECKGSKIEGETTAEAGEPLPGRITVVTWWECSSSLGACTKVVSNATAMNPWMTAATATTGGSGTMTISNPQILILCGNIECEYSSTSITSNVTGGNNGTKNSDWTAKPAGMEPALISLTKVSLNKIKGPELSCGNTGTLTAEDTPTAPGPMWLTN